MAVALRGIWCATCGCVGDFELISNILLDMFLLYLLKEPLFGTLTHSASTYLSNIDHSASTYLSNIDHSASTYLSNIDYLVLTDLLNVDPLDIDLFIGH